MAKFHIFVDGAIGTTGLRIFERLSRETDIELMQLPEKQRKDLNTRLHTIGQADLTFLCLPDEAAKEIINYAPTDAKICDTSTAHRIDPNWVYGLAELSKQTDRIRAANRVAIPGCHATGFISLIRPLVEMEAILTDFPLTCHSITGFSGGGKAMIADYNLPNRLPELNAPRLYGLSLQHKHLPEMTTFTGITQPPLFTPVVADFYSGILVSIPLPMTAFSAAYQSGEKLTMLLQDYYRNRPLITVKPFAALPESGMLAANTLTGKDNLEIALFGNNQHILLTARFDNLGKGASGAAIQCMNLMLGREETAGLSF
ncbi:N-acetyl-gamma-glutamyl-phosphate reductase [Nicoletella semolina]|uniref:N-acetyl-gamma-glutamyl-phosphate reductase n=1 Tax=Nicoletella semolina TaxID=271160 RepID=A0A4R2N6J5_9PAST|nr:N-acetyl-gamma-glutamyl-phosphate reductase [Nicoletella semolina]MDH2925172.1 N-acetyl-gamma-glutamyl-phosphate reductase [Nicoletella semolina]TCP16517.1 N-acetyl-gamma-glutamyl-phosphate reductase [Nicoletella semolina]